jgi:hypothetical protein
VSTGEARVGAGLETCRRTAGVRCVSCDVLPGRWSVGAAVQRMFAVEQCRGTASSCRGTARTRWIGRTAIEIGEGGLDEIWHQARLMRSDAEHDDSCQTIQILHDMARQQ